MPLPEPQVSANTGIRSVVRDVLGSLHTAMPGEIVSVDAGGRTGTVRAVYSINPVEGQDIGFAIPPIHRVPLLMPRAAGFAISFPVAPGDGCLIVFCDHAVDRTNWDGGPLATAQAMRHAWNDCVALIGWQGVGDGPAFYSSTDLVVGREDGGLVLRITPASKVTIGNEISGVELLQLLADLLASLQVATANGFLLVVPGPARPFADIATDLATIKG